MAAYGGGCNGRGSTATYCVCLCHVARGADCDERSCLENGKGRKTPFFQTDKTRPVSGIASDHHVKYGKPNRLQKKPDKTSRKVVRALRRGKSDA